jgi:hypothetical protein
VNGRAQCHEVGQSIYGEVGMVDEYFKKIRKNQDILDVEYDDMPILGRLNVQWQGGE